MSQKYRSDIDGLRAVAVIAVMAFHYGGWLSGGFTGVDVFFVISGFLITQQITLDIDRGNFSISNFYARRIRRILPALVVMLAVVLLAGRFFLMPGDYQSLAISAAAAAFGASNFFFLNHTGYFDQAADLMPLIHTWSLGVEEQFYLVWPPALLALSFGTARLDRAAIVAASAIIGFGASLVYFDHNPKAAFFVVLPRTWELLLGGFLACAPQLRSSWQASLSTVLGLATISLGFFTIRETAFPGISALLPCLGAGLVIWPRATEVTPARLLGKLAPIGLISYSLYLWHWPVWVFYRIYINGAQPRITESFALALVSMILAIASYLYIERPFRKARGEASRVMLSGISAVLVVFCAATYVDSAEGLASRLSPEAIPMQSLSVMWEWPCRERVTVDGQNYCAFGSSWNSSRKAILWGDSHAEHLMPMLDSIGQRQGISFILKSPCPAALGGQIFRRWPEWSQTPDYETVCRRARTNTLNVLDQQPIDFVVLASAWFTLISHDLYSTRPESSPRTKASLLIEGLEDIIQHVKRPATKVILVADMASPYYQNVPECAMAAISGLLRRGCAPKSLIIDSRQVRAFFDPVDDTLADLARRTGITFVRPVEKMCDEASCLSKINGEFIWRDASHLRRNLSPETNFELAKILGFDQIFR